jgi:hypothetical protein
MPATSTIGEGEMHNGTIKPRTLKRSLPLHLASLFLSLLCAGPLSAQQDLNAYFRNDNIVRRGQIVAISSDLKSAAFRVDEVYGGDDSALGKEFEVNSVVQLGKFSLMVRDAYPSRTGTVSQGDRIVILFHEDGTSPARSYPEFVSERIQAVAELKDMRKQILYGEIDSLVGDGLVKSLRESKELFWSEHREGATVHPRVEELLHLLSELEKRSSRSYLTKIYLDSKENLLLRAAVGQKIRYEARGSHPDRAYLDLIDELRKRPDSPQHAIALLAVLNSLYSDSYTKESSVPGVGEIVAEALDAENRSLEYRLAFVRRITQTLWQKQFQRQRILAFIKYLETKPCDPTPGFATQPKDNIADWLASSLGLLTDRQSRMQLGIDDADLEKLHPTARQKLYLDAKPAK